MKQLAKGRLIGRWVGLAAGASGVILAGAVAPASARADVAHGAGVSSGPTINTFKAWDGVSASSGFGCGGASTDGQVITVPDGKTALDKFAFWAQYAGHPGSLVLRFEVYAWDGSKATGAALFESQPQTISFMDQAFHKLTVNTGGIAVTPGQQYVMFFSFDKDYEQCVGVYGLRWADVSARVYPDGNEWYLRSFGDESLWTEVPWHSLKDDLALKAYLS